jgi:hypothetical protein
MTTDPGTIDGLVGQLTILLAPLTGLTPAGAPQFLLDLGLPLTDAQVQQIAPVLSTTTGAAGRLTDLVLDLEAAIEAGQVDQILEKAFATGTQVVTVMSGFGQLASALTALNLPGTGSVMAEFAERLFSLLLADYLGRNTALNQALEFLGVLVRTDENVGLIDPQKPFYTLNDFNFDRIGGWLTNPTGQLADLYDWGSASFDGSKILAIADKLAAEAGLPVLYDSTAAPPYLDAIIAVLSPELTLSPRGIALQLSQGITGGVIERSGQYWTLTLTLGTNIPADTKIVLQPGRITVEPPEATSLSGTASAEYSYLRVDSDPLPLISIPGGSQVTVGEIDASITLQATAAGGVSVGLSATAKDGMVLITTQGADGFITTILGNLNVKSNFGLGASYAMDTGLHFSGSSALEIQLASHVSLGPVDINALTLQIGIAGTAFTIGLTADLQANLGPLVAVVQGMGIQIPLSLASGNNGNLGPLDVQPQFQPPTGAGLSVDAGVVSGGGFLSFDPARGEYAGALQLEFLDIVTVSAIGLIDTKLPDGSDGFSLLIILTADFGAGIQLGFGFTLNAVGGLLGVNRSMLFQPMMDGVRTGAIDSIMFPQNIIANAARIISDLRAIFPPQDGTFLIGPMAKIGWGEPTLVSLSVGVIVEIPPGDVAILGVLELALPAEDLPILVLRVNFAGALEFDKQRMYFFASLYDSHVLFITIEGEMGLLFAWGDNANFVVTVGGFNPQFNPPPLPFPSPQRISVSLINESFARIQADGYFAVTTNTVQFGTQASYFFGFSALSVSGSSSFDALIQFSPFAFSVSISTSFSVQVFGLGVYGIDISLTLSGPEPWHANGTASLSFFFFSIGIGIDFTWGQSGTNSLPPVAVMPILSAEFGKLSNWRAQLPAGAHLLVSLRPLDTDDTALVLHPLGTLQVSQRAIPLDLTIDVVGGQQPDDANRFAVAVSSPDLVRTGTLQEEFAPAHFESASDATKLSEAAYAPQDSGIEMAAAGDPYGSGTAIVRVVRYDVTIIDTSLRRTSYRFAPDAQALFAAGLRGNAAARAPLSGLHTTQTHPFDGSVQVKAETFAVARQSDNTVYHPDAAAFSSQSSARDYLNRLVAADPGMTGTLHVLPQFEVAG